MLVERGNERVVHRVVRNKGARFSLAGYGKLTNRARYDRKLTLALGERSDIPRQYFLKLLESASATVRARLEAANPQAAAAIRDTIDDVATAMQREVRKTSRAHTVAVREDQTTVQCAPDHRSQCARAGTRAGLRKDRRGAGEARRFFRRSG